MRERLSFVSVVMILVMMVITSSCIREREDSDIPRRAVMNTPKEKSEHRLLTLNSGALVEVLPSGEYVYQGDMILSRKQIELLDKTGSIYGDVNVEDSADSGMPVYPQTGMVAYTPDSGFKAFGRNPRQGMFWAMVRYTLHPSLSPYEKEEILRSIRSIESQTNARFYNATGKPTRDPKYKFDYPYIEFMPHASVNNSMVGRVGGRQVINIHNFSQEVILHEICHALGMFHEQCRDDRDSYVTVHYNNIIPGTEGNFYKETKNFYRVGAFDFNSIMLYGSYSFCKDPTKPTMTKKDGSVFGSAYELSDQDRMFINTFYLPYVSREDVCVELDSVMYDRYNRKLSEDERLRIQSSLNVNRCNHMVDPRYYFGGFLY